MFKMLFQQFFLFNFRLVKATGIVDSKIGSALANKAYFFYKNIFEPDISFLNQFVTPESSIVDVGANVGFVSQLAGKWLKGNNAKIFAFEPEQENFRKLNNNLSPLAIKGQFESHMKLVSEVDGTLYLELSTAHPADHRIGEKGIPMESIKLDTFLASKNWPTVSLVKIDVQGAETRVLKGAEATLKKFSPAIFLELDKAFDRNGVTQADEVMNLLAQFSYYPVKIESLPQKIKLTPAEVAQNQEKLGYADFLFLKF